MKYEMAKVNEEINERWIFLKWLKLNGREITEPLDGRSITMRSLWTNDTTPSMILYCSKGKYYFKDFSSGNGGDAIKLVELLDNKSREDAITYIKDVYNTDSREGTLPTNISVPVNKSVKYEVESRPLNTDDVIYWGDFGISLNTLLTYDVCGVKSYTVTHYRNDEKLSCLYIPTPSKAYAYKDGANRIAKIYLPGQTPKYLEIVKDFIFGFPQLSFHSDTCLIMSGGKDIMAMHELELDVEMLAPISESITLSSDMVSLLTRKYKYVFTLFDDDFVGKRMAAVYKHKYGILPVKVTLDKDIARICQVYSKMFQWKKVVNSSILNAINKAKNEQNSISSSK